MPAIHQLVAGFSHADAISNEALVLRDIFRKWGFESRIFSEARRILPELRGEAGDLAELQATVRPDDIVLLHLSIGSPANELFPALACRKALLYHNITPPDFFRGLQEQIASSLARGREQARQLAGVAEVVMADSAYNARELEEMGYGPAQVLPLVLDLGKLETRVNRKTLRQYDDGMVNVLFVGRCAPNKRIEDCLAAFYYFQRYVEPASRFIHVGSFAGTEQYHALLLTRMRELQLNNVDMPGSLPQDQLNACYRASHLFLCMSEHEGFCIPVIESMLHGVPVLAYDQAAVPETMDGAGVLFREKDYAAIAEMMGQLVRDQPLRSAVIEEQRARVARYRARNLDQELKALLAPLLGGKVQ